jgi:hypothetical protein
VARVTGKPSSRFALVDTSSLTCEAQMTSSEHLERLLRRAIREPGARPALYRAFLNSVVYILVCTPEGLARTIQNGRIVAWVRYDGVHVIPCFLKKKHAVKACDRNQYVFEVGARSVMETNKNCGLHLNPNVGPEMQLSPQDVATLLAHGTISSFAKQFTLCDDAKIARLTEELPSVISALTILFATHACIERAYCYQLEQPSRGSRSLVIGLIGDRVDTSIVHDISTVVGDTYTGDQAVDTCLMKPGGRELTAIEEVNIQPFYDRRWGAQLVDVDASPQ